MDFVNITLTILLAMVFILAAMVGYIYFKLLHLNNVLVNLVEAFRMHLTPTTVEDVGYTVTAETVATVADATAGVEHQPADVVPVETETKVTQITGDEMTGILADADTNVSAPVATSVSDADADVDDYQTKTSAELKAILTQKGIPYGKRDTKNVLITLLKTVS